jgi:hypothetical protein
MTKVKLAILAPLVAFVAFGSSYAIATCYEQYVRISCPSGQISPALIPGVAGSGTVTLVTPNATLTWPTTATNTLTQTHLCSTSATGGGIPCAGTDSKLSSGWLPSLSGTYVPWSDVEGTGTATSTASGKIVNAADPRLSDARTPTGNLSVVAPGYLKSDTGTATATSLALSVGPIVNFPTVSVSTAGLAPQCSGTATQFFAGDCTWSTPSSSGLGFKTTYSVDYTAQPTLTIVNGANVIDGRGYWALNQANTTTFQVTNGTGLVIQTNATSSNDSGNTITAPLLGVAIDTQYSGGAYGLFNIPPSSSAYELRIWVMATITQAFTANYDRAVVGFAYNANDYGNLTNLSYRVRQVTGYNSGASCTNNFCQHQQVNTTPNASDGTARTWASGTGTTYDVFVFHVRGYEVYNYYGQSTGGAFPAWSTLTKAGTTLVASAASLSAGIIATADYPTVFFLAAQQNTNAKAGIIVQQLKVEAYMLN